MMYAFYKYMMCSLLELIKLFVIKIVEKNFIYVHKKFIYIYALTSIIKKIKIKIDQKIWPFK